MVCDVEFAGFSIEESSDFGVLLLFVSLPGIPKKDLGKEAIELY